MFASGVRLRHVTCAQPDNTHTPAQRNIDTDIGIDIAIFGNIDTEDRTGFADEEYTGHQYRLRHTSAAYQIHRARLLVVRSSGMELSTR